MGRLLILFGLLLVVVGVIAGGVSMVNALQKTTAVAIEGPVESEVCQPGESLVEETGASEYTPGQGYGRPVQYFCVDADGTRRNVTGEFVNDLFGSITSALPELGIGMLFLFLPCIGVPLIVVGVILVLIRRKPSSVVSYGG